MFFDYGASRSGTQAVVALAMSAGSALLVLVCGDARTK